jgi:hypothetical protein
VEKGEAKKVITCVNYRRERRNSEGIEYCAHFFRGKKWRPGRFCCGLATER